MLTKQVLTAISTMFPWSKTFTLSLPVKESYAKPKIQKNERFLIFKGLFLAMLSAVLFSFVSAIVKDLKNLHPGQLAVYRFIGMLVFSLPSAVWSQENLIGPKGLRSLLVLRGVIGASNMFLNFLAFRYLPLGEAAVISSSAPVFVTVAARLFLKESCGVFQSITVLLTIVGIVLTTKLPLKLAANSLPYTREYLYGMIASFVKLLFSTSGFIILRKVKSVHCSIIMFNNGWVSVIETALLTVILGNFKWHDCYFQGMYIVLLVVLSYTGQILFTMSLQCELAGPVSTIIAASDIVLAFVWQIILFHDVPDALSTSGAVLVGFSVVFVGLKKWVSSLPPEYPHLKYIGWITK